MAAKIGKHTCHLCKPWKWMGNANRGMEKYKPSERRKLQPERTLG